MNRGRHKKKIRTFLDLAEACLRSNVTDVRAGFPASGDKVSIHRYLSKSITSAARELLDYYKLNPTIYIKIVANTSQKIIELSKLK